MWKKNQRSDFRRTSELDMPSSVEEFEGIPRALTSDPGRPKAWGTPLTASKRGEKVPVRRSQTRWMPTAFEVFWKPLSNPFVSSDVKGLLVVALGIHTDGFPLVQPTWSRTRRESA